MKVQHSSSLLIVWQLADLEARKLQAAFLEPNHLLISLCKIVDLDLPALLSKDTPGRDEILEQLLREVRRLRTVFRKANFDPARFRRSLRRTFSPGSSATVPQGRLHRTDEAKDTFADAEKVAKLGDAEVYPIHLLFALLQNDEAVRDAMLREAGVEIRRLRKIVRSELFPTVEHTGQSN